MKSSIISKRTAENILFFGCCLYVFTLPFKLAYNNIAIGVIILGWLLDFEWKQKLQMLKGKPLFFLLPSLYLIYVLGLFYTSNYSYALGHYEVKSTLILLPLIIGSSSALSKQRIELILKFFVLTVFIVIVICYGGAFICFLNDGSTEHFLYEKLSRSVINLHPIYLANYLALSIILIIFGSAWKQSTVSERVTRILLIAFFFFSVVLLSAISVLFFLLLFCCCMLFNMLKKRYALGKVIALLGLLIIFFSSIVISVPATRAKIFKIANLSYKMNDPDYAWNSLTIRLAKWRCSIEVIKNNPAFGVGVGDEKDELMKSYRAFDFQEGIRCEYNSHNQYLSTAMAGGLLGLSALILILVTTARVSLNRNDKIMLCFIILIFISFLTENFLTVQKGVAFFSFFHTLFLIRFYNATSATDKRNPVDNG